MPFTGRRYCIIWYKVFDRRIDKPATIFEPAEIVYERHATAPRLHGRAFSSDEDGDGLAKAIDVQDTALDELWTLYRKPGDRGS